LKELSVKLPGEKDDDELIDPVEEFADFIANSSITLADDEIIAKAKEIGIRYDKATPVLVQVLLNDQIIKEKQIAKYAPLLAHFCQDEKAQKGMLGGIERLVVINFPSLLPAVSLILKALYDEDLVEEAVFFAWEEKASKKYVDKKDAKIVREKAAPFINWLKEAEEEED
jgi:translation initiation factor 5